MAPKNRPELESLIEGSIGELSPFHRTFGFYVDGVNIEAIILPDGWRERLVAVDNPNTNGFRGLCLDPTDLAVSKLAAGRPKDLDFVRVLLRERVVARPSLLKAIDAVPGLSTERRTSLRETLERLAKSPS